MIRTRGYLPTLVGRRVVLHAAGRSVEGVLAGVYPDALAVRHGRLLAERGEPVDLDGDTLIPRAALELVQLLDDR